MSSSYFSTNYGNPGVWGTAGPLPRTGNPGVWGTAGPLKKKKPAATSTNAAAAVQGYDPFASAMASTDQIIASLLADVQREQDAARDAAMREAALEAEKAQALAYGLKQLGIADTVNRIFQAAGANQANLAQGFSGQIRDQAAAQAAEQIRALTGTGQEGAVRNQGENMGNVQYGLGGSIPGTELSTLGAAFGAQQALEPGFALQFGQLAEAKRRQQWAAEQAQWADRQAEIIGKKPGLFQDFYSQERALANEQWQKQQAERDFQYSKWKDSRDFAYQKYVDSLNAQIAAGKLDIDKAQTALDQWEAANPEPLWKQDANGQWLMIDPRTGSVLGRVGNSKPPPTVKPTTTKGSGKINGLTASQYANNVQEATAAARAMFYGTVVNEAGKRVVAADAPGFDATDANTWGDDALGYQQALAKITRLYRLKTEDAVKVLNELYDTPGQDGRPFFSYAERALLRQKGYTAAQINKAMRPANRATPLTLRMLKTLGRA